MQRKRGRQGQDAPSIKALNFREYRRRKRAKREYEASVQYAQQQALRTLQQQAYQQARQQAFQQTQYRQGAALLLLPPAASNAVGFGLQVMLTCVDPAHMLAVLLLYTAVAALTDALRAVCVAVLTAAILS